MQSVPNPTGANPVPAPDYAPTFVIELEPWWRVFARNLGDLFRPAPPQVWLTSAPGQYWEDALVRRPVPWTVILASCVGHALLALAIYGITWSYLHRPRVMEEEIASSRPLDHFELSEYLPAVNSKPQEKPQPVRRRQPQQADPEYARQEIVSIQEQHDSIRQTIVNPVTPKMLKQDFPLPNIVAWTPVPSPAPVVANHSLTLPLPATPVVPPPQETARRNLAALHIPVQPQAVVPPSPSPAQRPLGDINFALDRPTVEAPKLPTPEQQAGSGTQQAQASQTAGAVPSAQPVTAGTGKAEGKEMG